MKKFNCILLIMTLCQSFFGQINLVPNPSFEDTIICPSGADEIYNANNWKSYGNSPDYFNSCSVNPEFSTPSNWGGYQLPASGNAYCAIGTFGLYFPNLREYIGAQLISPMIIGTKYFVSFKTSLSLSDTIKSTLATDKLGVLFTTSSYNSTALPPLDNFAHVYSDSLIKDTLNWVRINGSFIADSAYQFICVGNFFNDFNTDTFIFINHPFSFSYYYLDDFCVSTDSVFANNWTYISNEFTNDEFVRIFPNPTNGIIDLIFKDQFTTSEIEIYDSKGMSIYKQNLHNQSNLKIDLEPFSSGFFLILIKSNKNIKKHKLIKL